ncbi:unnamed protein product [Sphagnum compactum]
MAQASTFQVLFDVAELAIGIGGLAIAGWNLHLSRVRARTERTATVETGNTDQAELGDHADIEARALPGDLEDGLPDLEMGKLT